MSSTDNGALGSDCNKKYNMYAYMCMYINLYSYNMCIQFHKIKAISLQKIYNYDKATVCVTEYVHYGTVSELLYATETIILKIKVL